MIEWIEMGLERWADYYRDGHDNGLGYPSCSVEAKVWAVRGKSDNTKGDVPDLIAFMERVVLSMDDDMQAVVKISYMSPFDNKCDQARKLSRTLDRDISRQRMGDLLNHAHQYIEGYARGAGVRLKNA